MTTQNQGDKHFETLLALYLKQSQANKNSNSNQLHLDEDILSAFIEGTVTEKQAVPILRHLIDCGFCRRLTAKLNEINETFDDIAVCADNGRTNKWFDLWNNLTESIFRPYDNAVTAHEAEEQDDAEKPEDQIQQ